MVVSLIVDYLVPSCVEGKQLFTAFIVGMLFSRWSIGLISYFVFCFAYEVIAKSLCCYSCKKHNWSDRLSLFVFGMTGWSIGRVILKKHLYDRDFELKQIHEMIDLT
jgi:hypothetical protein